MLWEVCAPIFHSYMMAHLSQGVMYMFSECGKGLSFIPQCPFFYVLLHWRLPCCHYTHMSALVMRPTMSTLYRSYCRYVLLYLCAQFSTGCDVWLICAMLLLMNKIGVCATTVSLSHLDTLAPSPTSTRHLQPSVPDEVSAEDNLCEPQGLQHSLFICFGLL